MSLSFLKVDVGSYCCFKLYGRSNRRTSGSKQRLVIGHKIYQEKLPAKYCHCRTLDKKMSPEFIVARINKLITALQESVGPFGPLESILSQTNFETKRFMGNIVKRFGIPLRVQQ